MLTVYLENENKIFNFTFDNLNETYTNTTLTNLSSFLLENSNSSSIVDSNENLSVGTLQFDLNHVCVENTIDASKQQIQRNSCTNCKKSLTRKRRTRTRFTDHQTIVLEDYYLKVSQYPHINMIESLADSLKLPVQTLVFWFQNRRARSKKTLQKN